MKEKNEKKKVVFTQTPPEKIYVDFEDEEEELCYRKGCIYGNTRYRGLGDEEILQIVKSDYEDEEFGYNYDILEELEKVTGMQYETFEIKGYSQGEWNIVYLPKDENNSKYVEWIETLFFGKYDEYYNKEYWRIKIPHSISWKGAEAIKKEIASETDLTMDEITLQNFTGYSRIANYEEA